MSAKSGKERVGIYKPIHNNTIVSVACDITKSWPGSDTKCLDKEQSTIKVRPKPLKKSLNLIKCIKDNVSNLRCSHWISEHTYALLSH